MFVPFKYARCKLDKCKDRGTANAGVQDNNMTEQNNQYAYFIYSLKM